MESRLRADLKALWRKVKDLPPDEASKILQASVPVLIDKYGAMAGSVAADWFEKLTGERGWVPDSYRREAWEASVRWACGELFGADRGDAEKAAVFQRLTDSTIRHTRQYARDTIDRSTRKSGGRVLYARRAVGETCDFCLMLASRGPVYGSAKDAGEGNDYHDKCNCEPVPVKGKWVKDESVRGSRWDGQDTGYDFEKLYNEEYKPFWRPPDGKGRFDDIRDVLKRKRAFRAAQKNDN